MQVKVVNSHMQLIQDVTYMYMIVDAACGVMNSRELQFITAQVFQAKGGIFAALFPGSLGGGEIEPGNHHNMHAPTRAKCQCTLILHY